MKGIQMSAYELAGELLASGWPKSRKLAILAARYYKGLETLESLGRYLSASEVLYIAKMR